LAAHFANLLDGFFSVQRLFNSSKISTFRFLRRNRVEQVSDLPAQIADLRHWFLLRNIS